VPETLVAQVAIELAEKSHLQSDETLSANKRDQEKLDKSNGPHTGNALPKRLRSACLAYYLFDADGLTTLRNEL
jgi:hypothetical protein